jgi:hypothetical protein
MLMPSVAKNGTGLYCLYHCGTHWIPGIATILQTIVVLHGMPKHTMSLLNFLKTAQCSAPVLSTSFWNPLDWETSTCFNNAANVAHYFLPQCEHARYSPSFRISS